uniref:Uncharacterized protein n=1 Tax=Arundo donax TaxID=35708 RepID=A0A0A8YJT3_ARUDO
MILRSVSLRLGATSFQETLKCYCL